MKIQSLLPQASRCAQGGVSAWCGGIRHGLLVALAIGLLAVPSTAQAGNGVSAAALQADSPAAAKSASQETKDAAASPSDPAAEHPFVDFLVELSWSSDSPRRWGGQLSWASLETARPSTTVSAAADSLQPRLYSPSLPAPDPVLAAGVMATAEGGLVFGPPSRLTMVPSGEGRMSSVLTRAGKIQFRVFGRANDAILLRLEGDSAANQQTLRFELSELAARLAQSHSVDGGSHVRLQRLVRGDLPVRFGNGETVFWKQQLTPFSLRHPVTGPPVTAGTQLTLDCVTIAAKDQSIVSVQSVPVSVYDHLLVVEPTDWRAPDREGAYRVHFLLRSDQPPSGWMAGLASTNALMQTVSRSFQSRLPQSMVSPWLGSPVGVPGSELADSLSEQARSALLAGSSLLPEYPQADGVRLDENLLAESVISVAVISSAAGIDRDSTSPAVDRGAAAPANDSRPIAGQEPTAWSLVGTAKSSGGSNRLSRLFLEPPVPWLPAALPPQLGGGNAAGTLSPAGPLAAGQQRDFTLPVGKLATRHRVKLRFAPTSAVHLVAEIVDIETATGQARPLGPGLSIVQNTAGANSPPAARLVSHSSSGDWQQAVIDFWPQSAQTHLVLSNRHGGDLLELGPLEVWAERTSSPAAENDLAAAGDASADPSTAANAATDAGARLAMMRLEIDDLFWQFGNQAPPTADRPLDYQTVWTVTERLIQTLKREGYSGAILTVSSDGAALYPDRSLVPCAAMDANWHSAAGPVNPLQLMLSLFEAESLKLIPCLRPSAPALELESKIISQPASAASIAVLSPLAGQLGAWHFDAPPLISFPLYNSANTDVIAHLNSSLYDLMQRCQNRVCVPMVGLLADERSYLRSPPLAIADRDTLDQFHASLGPQAPPRETLETWVMREGQAAYDRWRQARLAAGLGVGLAQKGSLPLLIAAVDSALPPALVELGRNQRVLTTRLLRRSMAEPIGARIRDEACNASITVQPADDSAVLSYKAATFHQPITAVADYFPQPASATSEPLTEPPLADNPLSPGVTPLLDPTESALALAHLLSRGDRGLLAIGGGAMNQPGSDVRRRSLLAFTSLPSISMPDVPSRDASAAMLRVRLASYHGKTYISLVNPMHWPVTWEASLSQVAEVHQLGRPVHPLVQTTRYPAAGEGSVSPAARTHLQVTLEAGEVMALQVDSAEAGISRWQAQFGGQPDQLDRLAALIQGAVDSQAAQQHRRPSLLVANASFESDGPGVPGWMLAQYPTDCAALDSTVACDGKRSMRLSAIAGQQGSSWIVSQTFPPPQTGRLAIAARFRGRSADAAAAPLTVRMALEGTIAGTPIQKQHTVTIAGDGQWSEPQWLEIEQLPDGLPLQSLRLTVDLMSPGTVWVDDIQCYDQFMSAAEQTHWEQLVFLAARGISRGDLLGASRLLDSPWAPELVKPTPLRGGQGGPIRPAAYQNTLAPDEANTAGTGNIAGMNATTNGRVTPVAGSASAGLDESVVDDAAPQTRPGGIRSILPKSLGFGQ